MTDNPAIAWERAFLRFWQKSCLNNFWWSPGWVGGKRSQKDRSALCHMLFCRPPKVSRAPSSSPVVCPVNSSHLSLPNSKIWCLRLTRLGPHSWSSPEPVSRWYEDSPETHFCFPFSAAAQSPTAWGPVSENHFVIYSVQLSVVYKQERKSGS